MNKENKLIIIVQRIQNVKKILPNINLGIHVLNKMSSLYVTSMKTIDFSFIQFIPYNIEKLVCTDLQKIKVYYWNVKKNQIILNLEETSVREHFKELEILTIYRQDTLDVILLF